MERHESLGIPLHPEFGRIHAEAHRPAYEPIEPPARLLFLLLHGASREDELAHWSALAGDRLAGAEAPRDALRLADEDWTLHIQRHVESTRYLFSVPPASDADDPFGTDPLARLPEAWIAGIPGRLLLALDLACVPRAGRSDEEMLALARRSLGPRLAGGRVGRMGSAAFAALSLRAGTGRMLVFAGSSSPHQTGRLVGRLLDVESYRTLALLGWPEARGLLGGLPEIEAELQAVAGRLARPGVQDEAVLHQLLDLGLGIERRLSQHTLRFSATQAYCEVLERRLRELDEKPIGPVPTLASTLRRRLDGVRDTTASVARWLAELSRRAGALGDLLRTRVSIRQEAQQQELLTTMNRRFALQFRLQRMAELLSVAIFTYYASHILEDVATAAGLLEGLGWTPAQVRAASAPLLAGLAIHWLLRARRRARHLEETD